jgi:hypothetical protein
MIQDAALCIENLGRLSTAGYTARFFIRDA